MEPTGKHAVILIQRVVDAENTNADHLATSDLTMQTVGSSYSRGPDANIILKQESRSRADSSTLLSREQSTTCSDTGDEDAHAEDPSIPENDMVFALRQKQVDEHYNDDNSTNKEGTIVKKEEQQKSIEEASTSEVEKLSIRQKERAITINTESIKKQANGDEEKADDLDINANNSEPIVEQKKKTVNGNRDNEDTMTKEFAVKHEPVEAKEDDIKRHRETREHISADTDYQDNIYKCARCPHRTADFLSLMKHRQTLHSGRGYEGTSIKNLHLNPILEDPNYYCRACERRFPTKNNYKKHLRMVHHISPLEAHASDKVRNGSNKINQSSTAADPQEPKFNCRFCNKLFDSKLSLTQHQINDHNKRNNGKMTRCIDCSTHYKSSHAYMQHRKLVHNAKTDDTLTSDASATKTPGSKITCKVCGMSFGSLKAHLSHCNSVHRVYKKKAPEKSDKDIGSTMATTATDAQEQPLPKRRACQKVKTVRFVLPDSDPSSAKATAMAFQCNSCEIGFDTRPDLTRHRWSVHKNFNNSSPKKRSVQPHSSDTSTASFRCSSCFTKCGSRSALVVHMWATHPKRMRRTKKESAVDGGQTMKEPHKDSTLKTTHSPRPSPDDTLNSAPLKTSASVAKPLFPDINDPNFYCIVCDKTSRSKSSFYSHLLAAHSATNPSLHKQQQQQQQQPPTKKRAAAVLDIDDPNNHCAFCDHTFENQDTFYKHLRSQHHIKRKLSTTPDISTSSNLNSNASPSSQGKHLCSICRQRQATLGHHRQHLRLAHKVKLPPVNTDVIQFRYPNELIDVNSPDLYCAQCDHYFNTKIFFKKHVEGVHRMTFST